MAKQIILTYNDKEYTLEFTRKTIESMERSGFIVSELSDKPVSTLPRMFAGAFKAHHPFVQTAVVNEIFDSIEDKEGLINKLSEMYSEPVEALMQSGTGKNAIHWTPNF